MLNEGNFFDRYVHDMVAAVFAIRGQLLETMESPERQKQMTALLERLHPELRDAPTEEWAATLAVFVEAAAEVAWDYYQNPPS